MAVGAFLAGVAICVLGVAFLLSSTPPKSSTTTTIPCFNRFTTCEMYKEPLGQGGLNRVFKLIRDDSKAPVAARVRFDDKTSSYKKLGVNEIREIRTLVKIPPHPNVLEFYRLDNLKIEKEYIPATLVPFMNRGSLDSFMYTDIYSKNREHYFYYFGLMACRGIEHIQKNGVILQDIKPANMLVHDELLKISDFVSDVLPVWVDLNEQNTADNLPKRTLFSPRNAPFTELWASPEQSSAYEQAIQGNSRVGNVKISRKTDVWSLGIVLAQLVHQKRNFVNDCYKKPECKLTYNSIQNIEKHLAFSISSKAITLLKKMVSWNPDSRPNMTEVTRTFEEIYMEKYGKKLDLPAALTSHIEESFEFYKFRAYIFILNNYESAEKTLELEEEILNVTKELDEVAPKVFSSLQQSCNMVHYVRYLRLKKDFTSALHILKQLDTACPKMSAQIYYEFAQVYKLNNSADESKQYALKCLNGRMDASFTRLEYLKKMCTPLAKL